MVGLFIYQRMPRTELSMGDTKVVIKESSSTKGYRTSGSIGLFRADEKVVEPLSTGEPEGVAFERSADENEFVFPVAGHGPENVISVFGDQRGKTRLHKGIDIKAPRSTAVVAVTDGYIERIREGGSGGKQLYLRDAKGRLFYYAHLEDWRTEEFTAVKAGDVIATVGDTGNAKGTTPHLHFEIMLGKEKKAVDPLKYWRGV